MKAHRSAYWEAAALLAGLALYTATRAPGLLPADEGEFQQVVYQLGIAHPPGYPLYTLIGWAFTRLPLGAPAARVNLFSALAAALALAVLCRAVRQETRSGPAGLVAALALGTATSFWATATQASIRPMTALFVALLLDALLAYRRARSRRALRRFALVLGLGITHHASIAFAAAVFAAALLAADPALLRRPRRWPVPAFALGFLPWLYLPLRAAALDLPELGADLTTWSGFWQHVLARGFGADIFYTETPGELLARLQTMGDVLAFQWHGLVLVLAALAALMMLWRDRWLLFALGGAFALHTFVAATYRAPQTVEYMLPAYVCAAAALGWAFQGGGGGLGGGGGGVPHPLTPLYREREQELPNRRFLLLGVFGPAFFKKLAALLAVALTFTNNLPGMAYRHTDTHTRRFAQSLLDAAPEGAALLANWHWVTPLRYMQRVEGQRPDVTPVYVYPQGAEPLGETWVRRAGDYLEAGRPVVVQGCYPDAYRASAYTFAPQIGGPGWHVLDGAEPAPLAEAHIAEPDAPYAPAAVTLAWPPQAAGTTSFVHLVDPDTGVPLRQADLPLPPLLRRYTLDRPPPGELVAGLYSGARIQLGALEGAPPAPLPPPTENPRHDAFAEGITLTGYDYDRARLYLHWAYAGAVPAEFAATLSRDDLLLDTQRFHARPGDHFSTTHDLPPGIDRVHLALEEARCGCLLRVLGPLGVEAGYGVALPGPADARYVPLGSGVVLTGVEVRAPEVLAPGAEVHVALAFRAAYPLVDDVVVKVDLIGADWAWRAQSDHIPAMGAIPTLKWTWGSRVTDRHTLTVPEAAAPGQGARLELLLYDHFTGRPLPLLDPALAAQGQTLLIWEQDGIQ